MSNSFHIPYGKQDITQSDIDAVVETLNHKIRGILYRETSEKYEHHKNVK